MALQFLSLPSSPRSLPFSISHSPAKPYLSISLKPAAQRSHLSHREHYFSSLTTRIECSPTATATATKDEEEAQGSAEVLDRRRLYAQNIPWTCTADDIRALFEKYGTVLDVELSMYNKIKNRGLAFITMASEEEAAQALNNLTSYDLDGRIIRVTYSTSRKKVPIESEVPIQKYIIYVGNLAWRVRSKDLLELFKSVGNVISAEVVYQSKPRRPAGYAFVSFASREEAEAAISMLNEQEFMGRPLRLGFSKQQADIQNDADELIKASTEENVDDGRSEEVSNEA